MEGGEDMGTASSCSSPGEKSHDDNTVFIELTDDFSALDGEVGKRFDRLVPVAVSSDLLEFHYLLFSFER